jgi:DNA polymerase
VGDLGQIEARVLAMLAGQESMIATFRAGLDLYTEFAKAHFEKDEINKDERQLSKAMCLGLSFSMGINKFRDSVAKGFMGTQPVHLTEREARQAVNNYRRINHSIVSYWEAVEHEALELAMQLAPLSSVDWGGYFKIEYNAIRLPNGMRLRYPGLWRGEDGGLSFFNGKAREAIYSGKIVENLTQATARLFMADAWRAISKLYPVVLSCHDELGILAPEDDAEAACKALETAMTTPPAWMPDIPLTAEVQWAKNYSK